jgi:predicted ATP-dependent Lon-type protease
VLLAVLLACVCVDGRQIRKERKRAEAREAELTRRIDEARMVAHKRAEELDFLIGDVRQTLQERWDAYTEQIAALSKTVAEIPTDQLQEIYDSEKQFQAGLSAIMNYGQQSYGLTKERVRND